jgi:hypothetical protein
MLLFSSYILLSKKILHSDEWILSTPKKHNGDLTAQLLLMAFAEVGEMVI